VLEKSSAVACLPESGIDPARSRSRHKPEDIVRGAVGREALRPVHALQRFGLPPAPRPPNREWRWIMFAKLAQWRAAHAARAARAGYDAPANDNRRPRAPAALHGTRRFLTCRWREAAAGAPLTCTWELESETMPAGDSGANGSLAEPLPRRRRQSGTANAYPFSQFEPMLYSVA
jgi:hypothetical protein